MNQDTIDKIKELERRCPDMHISVEYLAVQEVPTRISLYAPSPISGRMQAFVVDLAQLGQTLDGWLDAELLRHEPQEDDQYYRVLCRNCGLVQIGLSGYQRQMSLPDYRWVCPKCYGFAEFDDDQLDTKL